MLTDLKIRKAKPASKPYKLVDGNGLHLFISPSGGKLWRYRYGFGGREKLLSIGAYPDVSLADAREARDEARAAVRSGKDPGVLKRQRKLAVDQTNSDSFESIAREWHANNEARWVRRHGQNVLACLSDDVFPIIGNTPTRHLKPTDVLTVVRKIEARGAFDTAKRVRQRMSAVFEFAVAMGRADANPAASILKVMATPPIANRQPAIIDLQDAREILERVERTPAHPVTKLAMRFLALTAVRPGTLISTPWTEFSDLDSVEPTWDIPPARMKLRLLDKQNPAKGHLVPLSRQAMETLQALRTVTGNGPLLFPNGRSAHRPMSENALGYLLNRAGYHYRHVPHGWRSTFSTVMNERYREDRAVIDLMLAHTPKDRIERAYNRAEYLPRRREIAQLWADLILEGRPEAASLLTGRRHGSREQIHLG